MENEKRQIEASKKWAEIGRKIDISQARYPEFVQLAERLIQGQEIEITEKNTDLLWTKDRAQRVAEFLKSLPEPPEITIRPGKTQEEDTQDEESYHWSTKERGKVIQRIAFDLLDKLGFPTRAYPKGSLRKEPDKSNYSQDEYLDVTKYGLLPKDEGGPSMVSTIFAPRYQEGRDLTDERTRRGLAHEIIHVIRAQVNPHIWREYKAEAQASQLEEAKVGGFKVGSNMLGSEAIGELMRFFIEEIESGNESPTVNDITPRVEEKLKERLDEFKKKTQEQPGEEIKRTRYFVANIALLHHLRQLAKIGCGNIQASRLLAIGANGYISFEKLPELIEIGIINKENIAKLERVILEITRWLREGETGFKIR